MSRLKQKFFFLEHFIIKILRIKGCTNSQNFIPIETNQLLKSVNFHLKNYVEEVQKFNIF